MLTSRPRRSAANAANAALLKASAPRRQKEEDDDVITVNSDDEEAPPILEIQNQAPMEEKEEKTMNLAELLNESTKKTASSPAAGKEKVTIVDPFPADFGVHRIVRPCPPMYRGPGATSSSTPISNQHSQLMHVLGGSFGSVSGANKAKFPRGIVGSNTSRGPAKLLDNRKRELGIELIGPGGERRSALEAYNGGHPGMKFQRLEYAPPPLEATPLGPGPSASATPPRGQIDIGALLKHQPVVKMEVRMGVKEEPKETKREEPKGAEPVKEAEPPKGAEPTPLEQLDRKRVEVVTDVSNKSSQQNLLLGSMVINRLNELETQSEKYENFSTELFKLVNRYR